MQKGSYDSNSIIYLAGQHTYPELIAEICGGGNGKDFCNGITRREIMKIYLAGGAQLKQE